MRRRKSASQNSEALLSLALTIESKKAKRYPTKKFDVMCNAGPLKTPDHDVKPDLFYAAKTKREAPQSADIYVIRFLCLPKSVSLY